MNSSRSAASAPAFAASPTVSGVASRWRLLPASEFRTIAAQWDELNDASFRSPLLTAEFVGRLLENFGGGNERIALFGDGALLVAAAIVGSRGMVAETFQPSQAPIGMWLQRGRAIPSQHGSPAHAASDAASRALSPTSAPPLDTAALLGLAPRIGLGSVLFSVLQLDPEMAARPIDGPGNPQITTGDYIRTARITIAGTFDAYWAARGKNLRANMKKQRAKLEAERLDPRHTLVTDPADVAAAIADYGRLESASWKAAGGTAIAADNAQGRFYRELLEDHCARGAGRVYRYFYGDKVVAMDLCVSGFRTMVILKTTFDETIKGSSPAHLMRHEYLPAIFENREFERVEFYGRVMDWHTKWSDEIRTLYHVTAFRWAAAQRLYRWRQAKLAERVEDDAKETVAKSEAEEG